MRPLPPIAESDRLYARAAKLIPAGTQTLAKGPRQHVLGVAPKYLARGKGCRVWDVDGNELIDMSMAIGPLVLGYASEADKRARIWSSKHRDAFGHRESNGQEVARLAIGNQRDGVGKCVMPPDEPRHPLIGHARHCSERHSSVGHPFDRGTHYGKRLVREAIRMVGHRSRQP